MRAGPSPSACRSRWQANTIRARSTRLAGSVRERAIETSLAKSSSPIDNSIARRRAVMIFEARLANQKKQPTGPQRPNESLTKDRFLGIDELETNFVKSHILRRTKAGDRRLKLQTQPHFAVNPKTMHDLSVTI